MEGHVMKGLPVDVYRAAHGIDCTQGGISSKVYEAVLIGDGVVELFSPSENYPALYLHRQMIGGQEYLHCGPEKEYSGRSSWIFGGNFVYCGDPRFPNRYPIPVHDRRC
jgi:hypothetical protein